MNAAVTDTAPDMVRVHGRGLLQTLPVQPVKREPFAVSFTTVPMATGMEQSLLQRVEPRGVVMVTVPMPVPAFERLNWPIWPKAAAPSMRGLMAFW